MTAAELADAIGVTSRTITRWETGVRDGWTDQHLQDAAKATNVPAWFIHEGFNGHTGQNDGEE